MLTVLEVCDYFRVSKETVLSWIGSGDLSAVDVAPAGSKRRFYRIPRESLEAFERARRLKRHGRLEPLETREVPQYV